jgi:hypothetical protein
VDEGSVRSSLRNIKTKDMVYLGNPPHANDAMAWAQRLLKYLLCIGLRLGKLVPDLVKSKQIDELTPKSTQLPGDYYNFGSELAILHDAELQTPEIRATALVMNAIERQCALMEKSVDFMAQYHTSDEMRQNDGWRWVQLDDKTETSWLDKGMGMEGARNHYDNRRRLKSAASAVESSSERLIITARKEK